MTLDNAAAIPDSRRPNMDRTLGVFERALEAERRRNARQAAAFRIYGSVSVFAVNLAFTLLRPGYTGAPILSSALYCLAAVLLWWGHTRFAGFGRWSALSIPLIDMPFIFTVIGSLSDRLREIGYVEDAATVGTLLPLFYIALILAASLSLEARYTWFAVGTALVLQTWQLTRTGRDISFVSMVSVTTLMAAGLGLSMHRRSIALVKSAAEEQTRREHLGRYFSPQVAEALADVGRVPGEGKSHEVSVLFADIRDFTARAEGLSSDAVVALLNDFHARMVDCVFRHGGTLDKYLGDGLMAYFGAPVEQSDHAERAVRCALDMQRALEDMNRSLQSRRVAALKMGIGVHSGPVVLGDIGAERRREFTVIGDTVNVAARVEQLTKVCDAAILVSEETRRRVVADFGFVALEPLPVKGKSMPLQTYRVPLR